MYTIKYVPSTAKSKEIFGFDFLRWLVGIRTQSWLSGLTAYILVFAWIESLVVVQKITR